MANRNSGFNKGRSSKFCEGSWVRQTPEEGRRTYRPKRCGNNNKDEDNSPKTLTDKNHQASSQKLRQQTLEEGWRTHQPKSCENNNKDEDNSPKTLNDKNYQPSSQKFRQLIIIHWYSTGSLNSISRSLLDDIITSVGYLMPKTSLWKNGTGNI